jgi:hypothetical protein
VLAYVLKPRKFYEFAPNMVCFASKADVPDDLVFVTYACPDPVTDVPGPVRGTVTHWGFVEADRENAWLPVNHSSRYRTRVW